MKSTIGISKAKNRFPSLVEAAEKGAVVTITRRNSPVAILIGRDRMEAIAETMEVLSNQAAVTAVKQHRSGKTRFGTPDDIRD